MPLLLAPYNSAMRLGSGFNSYTQELCVNNAVVKDNREFASAADLRPAPGTTNDSGETCQSVNWTSNFVDTASDVLTSLNISGSLAIKFGLSGGAKGEGAYLNTEKMKESDLNYLFQVRVVNQRLIGQDVTRFNNIPNIPRGSFTDIYGDCFISGFLEGGEFNALMSTKVHNKDKLLKISGAISANFKAGPVDVDVAAKGGYDATELKNDSTTSINVSWVGGGNIRRGDAGKEWTLSTMHAAALTFPEQVAKFPQYTHAILTKYTALRSYQELTNKGTPLDYENAGVYTATLLDAYMEYKLIWSQITTMTREMQTNMKLYKLRTDDKAELAEYASESQYDYGRRVRAYYGADVPSQPVFAPKLVTNADADASDEHTQVQQLVAQRQSELARLEYDIMTARKKQQVMQQERPSEAPLKPNAMVPYAASLIGFDRARRDCRWEMIKIVKEVDEVTKDPTVAIDPERLWVYLNPMVFRSLLPELVKPLPPYSQKWVDDAFKQSKDELEQRQTDLASKEEQLKDTAAKLKEAQDVVEKRDATIALLTAANTELKEKEAQARDLRKEMLVLQTTSENVVALQGKLSSISTASTELSIEQLKSKMTELQLAVTKSRSSPREVASRYGTMMPVKGDEVSRYRASSQTTTFVAQYGTRYRSEPKFVFALSKFKDVSGPYDNSWFSWEGMTTNCHEATTKIKDRHDTLQQLSFSWMANPTGIINNSGVVQAWDEDHRCGHGGGCVKRRIAFNRPYESPPQVAVWIVSFGVHASGAYEHRFRVHVNDVTATDFELVAESFDGSWCMGGDVGWCAWSADVNEVKVIKRNKVWGTKGSSEELPGKLADWDLTSDLSGRTPAALLTGIVGIDMTKYPTTIISFECSLKDDTGPNYVLQHGADSQSKVRYIESTYVAILEDY